MKYVVFATYNGRTQTKTFDSEEAVLEEATFLDEAQKKDARVMILDGKYAIMMKLTPSGLCKDDEVT
jgi:hypothetical protein